MSTDYYLRLRRRFISAVILVLVALSGVVYVHGIPERELQFSVAGLAVSCLLLVLLTVLPYIFLQQFKKLEQVNRKLEEQQIDLELKVELLDAASDAILLLDEKGQFVYFNTALQAMTGYSREELLLKGLHGIQPPEFAARIQENIKRVFDHGEAYFESAYVRNIGDILPIEVHARVTNVNGRTQILSMVRDIRERKESDNKIKTTIKEWQGTFDSVEDVVWLLDINRTIIRANKATESVFKKLSQDVIGCSCCEVSHSDMIQHENCPFARMLETKKRASMQLHIADRWFEVSVDPVFSEDATIINAVHIVKDITDLKKAEMREIVRSEILERIARGESLSGLLSFIATSIENENPGMLCSILLVSDDGKRLLNGAAPSLPDIYN
ncbi:MAG: PAS domain S-box protein, partial [Desulfuromonadales bacterium]